MTDFYAVLGVRPEDGTDVIKERYRKLAKQYHPDRAADKEAAEKRMREINEAWEILGDDEKRAEYDAKRNPNSGKSGAKNAKGGNAAFSQVDYDNLIGKFDSFFGKAANAAADGKKPVNPLDAGELFDKFMGIKRK
ncbi:MAG: DnaJ domain-containing protein [Oscillospiraceae bacterium]|jgi:DnaJ-class molecular chaperone|nr:DnaJ domain-containing protein [Oscillospiraceae bacterium]